MMEDSLQASGFRWLSPLGLSVICFLISAGIHLFIGVLTPIFVNKPFGRNILFISVRTDTQLFGTAPAQLLQQNAELAKFRTLIFGNAGGNLVLQAIFIFALTWFGLRQQIPWAYWTLTITSLLVLPYWYLTFNHYWKQGITLGFPDLPPIFWIPTLVMIPGIVLGWIALRS